MAFTFTPGRYIGRVEDQRFIESPRKGTPGFCLGFRPQKSLDDPSAQVKPYLRELTMWLTQATVNRRMRDLQRLGYDGEDLNGLNPDTEGFYSFVGQEVEVICTHDSGSGSWGDPFERWDLAPPARSNLANTDKLKALDEFLAKSRDQANGSALSDDNAADDSGPDISDEDEDV